MHTTPKPDSTVATLRRLAWLCMLLMLVVVTASAFLRHHAGAASLSASAEQLASVRLLHRVAATLVLLGAVALVVLARRAGYRSALASASALLGTGLLLSAVGLAAGASRAAPVVMVNLLGGYLMLALCTRLAIAEQSPSAGARGHGAARWLLALLFLQAAGGGWSSADASADCVVLQGCAVPPALHRVGGLLLGYALLLFGLMTSWRGRRAGHALLLVVLLSMLLGMYVAAVGGSTVPGLLVVHNALAALMILLLVGLSRR